MYMYHSDAYSLLHDILEYLVFAGGKNLNLQPLNIGEMWPDLGKPTFLAMQTFWENSITIFLN